MCDHHKRVPPGWCRRESRPSLLEFWMLKPPGCQSFKDNIHSSSASESCYYPSIAFMSFLVNTVSRDQDSKPPTLPIPKLPKPTRVTDQPVSGATRLYDTTKQVLC
ncbi:hypothetical protein Ddc_09990 [Ditylenchus destructor]|nr:hypothetical protein Ddc_09990 [Ditylenchus destructor]